MKPTDEDTTGTPVITAGDHSRPPGEPVTITDTEEATPSVASQDRAKEAIRRSTSVLGEDGETGR